MLIFTLVCIILAIVFWQLSKFFGKLSRQIASAARHEDYFKAEVLGNLQGINRGVNPEPEHVDVYAELRSIDAELKEKEESKRFARDAVDQLLKETDHI